MNNHLLIKISKNVVFETKSDDNFFSLNHVSLTIRRNSLFEFDHLNYRYNEKDGILTAVLGYFSNWDELKLKYGNDLRSDVELLEKLYLSERKKNLSKMTTALDGIFLLFIYNVKQNKLYIFQSIFGYALPIYYASDDQYTTISTSLKALLENTNIKRELDLVAASAFIGQAIVQNERTLIKDVKKLVTHTYIEYDLSLNNFLVHWTSNKLPKLEEKAAKKNLVPSISRNIIEIAKNLKEPIYNSTLTRGWDTNLILSQLIHTDCRKLNLFSIDGGNNYSEIEAVKEILKFYENTELSVHEIDIKTLNHLPDIVWKYEGFVFEMGIFLRYDLAFYLLNGQTNHIFVGAGADPVLNSNMGPGGNRAFQHYGNHFYKSLMYSIKKRTKRGIIGDIWFKYIKSESEESTLRRKLFNPNLKVRYNIEIEYNLKMHEILFNSFHFSGLYPFLNKKTVASANELRKYNHKKAFYKDQLKELFGEKISGVIKKTGKVLDTDRLYFEKKESFIKILDKPLLEKIIGASNINKIKKNPDNYISIVAQLAYLYLFDKLFLSKNYDKYFKNDNLEISLDELI